MELKPYQQKVLNDLQRYLKYIRQEDRYDIAFDKFWEDEWGPYNPFEGKGMAPYKNDIPHVPHVCVKVPTAGGKTFIAANAINTVYGYYRDGMAKAVVWLVPSVTILEQTLRNLSNPAHPYRQCINAHFNNRVEVYRKEDLLLGSGFNPVSVNEQLSILVLSFDSLRSRKKEDRKFYQENGQLAPFVFNDGDKEHVLPGTDETALINVIRKLRPLVIVDEAHGAVSELSVEMLSNLYPSFVLDLTATPRANSNIISFVDAFELKKEHMVKLPVIVYNHSSRHQVIENAINLQRRLEAEAKQEEVNGGAYIRPIVLFQAQPKTTDDNITFEKIREALIALKIPAAQVKIKTAEINEIKNIDLLSRNCEVRYIITVNALKEGWDCPFAYVLASLADKSSAVDVEQILGRVLRQPYVKKHGFPLLNNSFVLTASSKFMNTLENIVQGLNKAGFSKNDYKLVEEAPVNGKQESPVAVQQALEDIFLEEETEFTLDTGSIHIDENADAPALQAITQQAMRANEEMEKIIEENSADPFMSMPPEILDKLRVYRMKDTFAESAKAIRLPQFFLQIPPNPLMFDDEEKEWALLSKENLLKGFELSKEEHKIDFDLVDPELYKVDLEKTKGSEYTPTFSQFNWESRERIVEYITAQPKENQVKQLAGRFVKQIGNLRPIADREVKTYVKHIVEDFTPQQMTEALYHEISFCEKIKEKIKALSDAYAKEQFTRKLDKDMICAKENYVLPAKIAPVKIASAIAKSLYENEEAMNPFEERMINAIANCENIAFWHRNSDRKGFYINGYINHYPDFIVQTKSGKIIVIETKGDFLDGENTRSKIQLGKSWMNKAGESRYKYFMVFEEKKMEGSYRLDEFLDIVRGL